MKIHKIKKIDNVNFEQAIFVEKLNDYFNYCESLKRDELTIGEYPTVYEYTGNRISIIEKNTLDIYRDYLNDNELDSYIEDVNYIVQENEVPMLYEASTKVENEFYLIDTKKLSNKTLLKDVLTDDSFYYFFKFEK